MPRLPLVVLVTALLLGTAAGIASVLVATGSSGPRGAARTSPTPSVQSGGGAGLVTGPVTGPGAEPFVLAVLGSWDRRRARAYARGDPAALAGLYVAGSRTAAADVAVLRGYRTRGLRVTTMATQVLGARVLRHTPTRLTVLVTDVLAHAVVDGPRRGQRWALPRDGPSQRRVLLRRIDGRWRVEEAYIVD